MSVFTPVSEADARALLAHYALGELERLEGIAQGVENTNYFLTTTTGEYVLTLFEHIPRADLPFYVGLMDHLSRRGVACPQPMRRENGEMLSDVNAKPACIGRLHAAGIDYDAGLDNWRGREWRESFAVSVAPRLSAHENALIASENRYQAAIDDSTLPQGIIHGDLFRDNVLWDDAGEGGVIDFYFACDDVLVYDLAIAVNDWCATPEGALDADRTAALVEGYERERPLEDAEREEWPAMLRRAALRTWLGRLGYNHFPRESHMTIPKDHAFSRRLLEHHVAHARPL
jgi:homoserine kinase type II